MEENEQLKENEQTQEEAQSPLQRKKQKEDEATSQEGHKEPQVLQQEKPVSGPKKEEDDKKESPEKEPVSEVTDKTTEQKVESLPKPKKEPVSEIPKAESPEKKVPSEKIIEPVKELGQETETPEKKPTSGGFRTEEAKDEKREFISRLSPLIFGKYDLTEVVVEDPGLRRYINLQPVGIPHTGAKHANKWFGKTKINIVERLINNLMRTEHTTGKKTYAYRTVKKSFEIIEKKMNKNPVQVFINALENSSPKEEITRLRFGGISVPKAVDTSSSHRLDVALRNICRGTVSASHKNKKRMEVCLAEEIILASKADMNSYAVSKKEEMERVAASAR